MRLHAAVLLVVTSAACLHAREKHVYTTSGSQDPALNAFDTRASTVWNAEDPAAWVQCDYSRLMRIREYSVFTPEGATKADFQLLGSDDKLEWTLLGPSATEVSQSGALSKTTHTIAEVTFMSYRLAVSSNSSAAPYASVAEVWFGEHIFSSKPLYHFVVENAFKPGGDMFISNLWGMWSHTTPWLEYNFRKEVVVTSYAMTYANGKIRSRVPRDFQLRGLRTTGEWVIVDRRLGETYEKWESSLVESRAGLYRKFQIPSPQPFISYRLLVHDDDDVRFGVVVTSLGNLEFSLAEHTPPP
eukprot:TRINITY_DN21713_c0_g1_i1.p1 TRINITY_DN21713_c0_g1~~TRINITY_DN21713_c0_g1_i1.p1  ORF type:complete len:350 (+),score=95.35 TRINITY_DN21713_c0_g1_i1:153-1052(+)